MARMMDRLRERGLAVPEGLALGPGWHRTLGNAPVFVADEQCAWYFEAEQEYWRPDRDFPCLAPPYPSFFVETVAPSHLWTQEFGREPWPTSWPNALGWLVIADRVTQEGMSEAFWDVETQGQIRQQEGWCSPATDPHWMVRVDLFLSMPEAERVRGPLLRWVFELNRDGGMVYDVAGKVRLVSRDLAGIPDDTFEAMTKGWLDPLLTTLTFLNAKNVEPRLVPAAPRLNRRRVARGRVPLVDYHVLDIKPFGPGRRTGSRSDRPETGRTLRLHSRRGGFRTYTAERPLFGRWVGTWFWEGATWVGDASAGRADKDYRVRGQSA